MIEDFDVLVAECFFLFCTLLRISRQGIRNFVSLALTIIDLEMVTKEFLSLTDLSRAQTFCVHKLWKVVMVDKHKNFMSRAF